ncbi:MAG TPA: CsgG/HfaB family protein [Myxococcales bacterium]|nr:CsgG/HfaB family protein [Myxococcales bacterium]
MRNLLTLAVLLAMPWSAFAQSQGLPTVAIAEVTTRGNASPDLASDVDGALTDQLVADGRFRVVERQQLAKVMKEQALAQSGVLSDEVQVKVAQLVGARFIVLGTVGTKGTAWVVSLRALDSGSAQVAFSETLRVGSDEQVEPGAKQLARRLADKLLGSSATTQGPVEVLGDFDAAQVKDSAREVARSLALRFPKLTGTIVNALPNGTASCSFTSGQPFKGEFFEISGRDDVTEQEARKGWFMLSSWSRNGCSGRIKREAGGVIEDGDTLTSMPIKIGVEAVQPGPGTQPELASLLANELRAALDSMPQFQLATEPQLTATGRVSGPRGRRSVDLQVIDKSGNVIQKVSLPASF